MISKTSAIEILKRLKPSLEKRYSVHSLALFGSYARGDQTAESDIDILVDVEPTLGLNFITLAETIEKALGVSVDLVSSRAIKPRYQAVVKDECIYV
jgi:uncharacterized protein